MPQLLADNAEDVARDDARTASPGHSLTTGQGSVRLLPHGVPLARSRLAPTRTHGHYKRYSRLPTVMGDNRTTQRSGSDVAMTARGENEQMPSLRGFEAVW
ncbi:hypothetical protein GCM10022295_87650 [Streptomyces osmaniensis]|uniref:Uncharacterized protein n=1 Tax=Streptomyces osmaniensis TaxID=593134 RepID=A0ABP6YWM4_9ACTN